MSNRRVFLTFVALCVCAGAALGVAIRAAFPSTWHDPEEGIN